MNNLLRTIVKTSITNKSSLVIKHTKTRTLNITHKRQTPNHFGSYMLPFDEIKDDDDGKGQLGTGTSIS